MSSLDTPIAAADATRMQRWHESSCSDYAASLSAAAAAGAARWDAVIVTASDDSQRVAYEAQLRAELAARRIPEQSAWHVVADSPGVKIGNGGSTLLVLRFLRAEYGVRAAEMRCLMIHAGGYSQRMPTHSVCGKIFGALPMALDGNGARPGSMLQLKLASFAALPSPARMRPGVFVTCADDVVFFDAAQCDFTRPGVTALAHRSPLAVAEGHGVFLLPARAGGGGDDDSAAACEASAFLHKPSVERMRARGAVLQHVGADASEFAWTDSSFFFDADVAARLLGVLDGLGGPLDCEVDCYGDFLQPLGAGADEAYMQGTANVVASSAGLAAVRRQLWDALRDVPLTAIPCHPSAFFHLGTFAECLHHLCESETFGQMACVRRRLNSTVAESARVAEQAVMMSTSVAAGATVGRGALLEYTSVGERCIVGDGCLLSGAVLPAGSELPARTFMQTSPLGAQGGPPRFVTHVLQIGDDIKTCAEPRWLGRPIGGQARLWEADCCARNVWNAALFPVASTEEAAVALALALLRGEALPESQERISLARSLAAADIAHVNTFRQR